MTLSPLVKHGSGSIMLREFLLAGNGELLKIDGKMEEGENLLEA